MLSFFHSGQLENGVQESNFASTQFRLGRQEDSHEFLRYLIQGLQEVQIGKLSKDQHNNREKLKNSLIFDTFGGMMKNCVLCHKCGNRSITSEHYYDLNIECQTSNSLFEGLANFFKSDQLTGMNKYYCEKCQEQNDARKSSYLTKKVPDVMTFQLKRFTNSLRKIGKLIPYPRFINMGKYFEQPIDNFRYQLYAITVHAGYSSTSGHYYSFVKWNGDWYEMNDSHVCKCSEEKVFNQQAYILFYKCSSSKQLLQHLSNPLEQVKQVQQNNREPKNKNENYHSTSRHQKHFLSNSYKLAQNSKDQFTKEQGSKVNGGKRKSEESNEILPPRNLRKRRSKQQALEQMTLYDMLLRYSCHLASLQSKIPSKGKRHRSFQPVYNLRKYEIALKRRKIC